MFIPVEYFGCDRQRIPAVLVKIEKFTGFVKFKPGDAVIKVPLSELQLAPTAFGNYSEDPFSHTKIDENITKSLPRDQAEIWLSAESTTRKKLCLNASDGESPEKDETKTNTMWSGAWWPGRVLTVHGGFVHVDVAAPLSEGTGPEEHTNPHIANVVRIGSSALPFRSALVKLNEVRTPWTGRPIVQNGVKNNDNVNHSVGTRNGFSDTVTLATPGVLRRHTICIPAYLARLASSPDAHSALLRFCDAPCLIQCDPEPFLSSVMAKRIMEDCDSAAASGRQTPSQCADSETNAPSVTVSVDLQSNATPWPPADTILQSSVLNAPNVAGTLSVMGVTDPTLLLEGLPDSNGPLVFLHIWSGSSEAVRRAALLELAHVRILAFRYHLLRKLSNGESGDWDLIGSMDTPNENGDAPAMYCKPISIPVNPDSEGVNQSGDMMIGYSAQFRVQPRLIGLAIGYHGSTIQEARSLPGVRAVEILPEGIIHVEAETVEGCHSVRNLLDYTETEIPVSPRLASRLIGSKGMNIQKLAASAGIRRARLLDPVLRKRRQQKAAEQQMTSMNGDVEQDHSETASVKNGGSSSEQHDEELPPPAFYILGTRPAVAKMRLLLEFQADNLNELDELEETRRNLSTQLRMSNPPGPRGAVSNGSAAGGPARGGGGFRGRGRRMTDQRAPSTEFPGLHDTTNQATRGGRPAYRGRPRPNDGVESNRPTPEFAANGQNKNEKDPGSMPSKPEPGTSSQQPTMNNGTSKSTGGKGNRNRNRPKNQPVAAT